MDLLHVGHLLLHRLHASAGGLQALAQPLALILRRGGGEVESAVVWVCKYITMYEYRMHRMWLNMSFGSSKLVINIHDMLAGSLVLSNNNTLKFKL